MGQNGVSCPTLCLGLVPLLSHGLSRFKILIAKDLRLACPALVPRSVPLLGALSHCPTLRAWDSGTRSNLLPNSIILPPRADTHFFTQAGNGALAPACFFRKFPHGQAIGSQRPHLVRKGILNAANSPLTPIHKSRLKRFRVLTAKPPRLGQRHLETRALFRLIITRARKPDHSVQDVFLRGCATL